MDPARNRSGRLDIALDMLKEVAKNQLMGFDAVRRWRTSRPRAANDYSDADGFLRRYAFYGLDILLGNGGDIKGKSVCEIGAGDYLTSGLSILAAGASRYAVIDRFPGIYDGETAKGWYRQIEKNWDLFYPDISWPDDLAAESFPASYGDRVEIIRQPIEAAKTEDRFDVVCSFQVGEHVSDIDAFAAVHRRLLTDGGIGIHRIDYGPHDCWFLYRDPLTFLRFGDAIWSFSGSNRGTPNRRRHHEFIEAFDRAGLAVEVLSTEGFDESLIDLRRLSRDFQNMPRESMLVAAATFRLSRKT